MAYTLGTVRNRVVKDKLDDVSYDATVVNGFINDALRSIFNSFELPFMEKIFTGVLPVDEYIFEFPTDYQAVQSLVLQSPSGSNRDISDSYVDYRTFNERWSSPALTTAGSPTVWTVYGNRLIFNVKTDGTYTLSMYYLKKPATLSDDAQIPDLPEEFEEVLVLGAYYRVLQRNEDYDLAAAVKQEFDEELLKMARRLGPRQRSTPHIMGQPRRMRNRRI